MKKIVFYMCLGIIFLVFPIHGFAQIEGMLDQQQLANLADRIAQVGKKRIAVVDFTDLQGNVTELGRFLAEEFSVALVGAGKGFEVIDRVHLKSILAEHKLALTGVIDPRTARELGKIAGVDAIVTGSITPFGDNIRVSFKVLDTETAMIIAASSGNIARTAAINELLERGIEAAAAPSESRTEQATTTPGRKKTYEKPVFKTDLVIITLDLLKKSKKGDAITAIVTYENIYQNPLPFTITSTNTYLTDENGKIWLYNNSSGIPTKSYIAVYPHAKLQSKILFVPQGDNTKGTVFTVSIGHSNPNNFSAIFENILAK